MENKRLTRALPPASLGGNGREDEGRQEAAAEQRDRSGDRARGERDQAERVAVVGLAKLRRPHNGNK
eukprot:15477475-Alexandrium_andersonii.AAC.1